MQDTLPIISPRREKSGYADQVSRKATTTVTRKLKKHSRQTAGSRLAISANGNLVEPSKSSIARKISSRPSMGNTLLSRRFPLHQKSKPVAIVLPAEPALKKFAADKGLGKPDDDLEDLVHNRKLEAAVHQELLAAGKRGGLGGIELIAGVVLVPEEWTPQNVGP